MKSNRWWLKNINLKTHKKWMRGWGNRGSYYTLAEFEACLNEMRQVKPGSQIFNLFANRYSVVKKVEFFWHKTGFRLYKFDKTLDDFVERKIPGSSICEWVTHTEDGYQLSDTPSECERYKNKQ